METEVILKDVKTVEELDAQREAFLEKCGWKTQSI